MYCLVAEANGKLGPLGVFASKYMAICWGLNAMGGLIDPTDVDAKYNGITEFQLWTDDIETVNISDARHYYRMGLADAKTSTIKPNKELGIKHNSTLYKIYERAITDHRYHKGARL